MAIVVIGTKKRPCIVRRFGSNVTGCAYDTYGNCVVSQPDYRLSRCLEFH